MAYEVSIIELYPTNILETRFAVFCEGARIENLPETSGNHGFHPHIEKIPGFCEMF